MKRIKKLLLTCAAISAIIVANSSAQAASLSFLDNWNLNLANATQGLTGSVDGIDQILYKGLTHVSVTDVNHDGKISVGDTFRADGLMYTTDFNGAGGSLDNNGLNQKTGYELTMKFSAGGQFVSTNPDGSLAFVHNAAGGDGYLNLYLDNLGDKVGVKANTTNAVGFTDGANIANFAETVNMPGTGGPFWPVTKNGSDDAHFQLVSQMASVFQKPLGTNLDSELSAVWTRSDFSTSGVKTPIVANWEAYFGSGSAATNGFNFFVDENGDARVVTPEPGTIALLGLGLAGLGFYSRRKKA